MSDFSVPIVKIGKIVKHPNASLLSIVEVDGCPVVIKTADFQEGDLAVYIPVEAVVPVDSKGLEFLRDPNHPERETARIKAKKLRGVFSMGLLIPISATGLSNEVVEGYDAASFFKIVKYEEPENLGPTAPKIKKSWYEILYAWVKHPVSMWQISHHQHNMKKVRHANFIPVYDMESLRKYRNVIQPGELVYVSEKLHGTNFRAGYYKGKFYVGSHKTFKGENTTDLYWKTAVQYDLQELLKQCPNIAVYGEIFGQVQDLKYGAKQGQTWLRVFDLYDVDKKRFLDFDNFIETCNKLKLPRVPLLYAGPYDPTVVDALASGASCIDGANNIREGFVIKPQIERRAHVGRVIFKLVSEAYLLRKGGSEGH
jgi:tRNA-binding EMAP/Myf-like protein